MWGTGNLRADVGQVHGDLVALCTALDPESVPLREVTSIWTSFEAMERLAAGAKCRLARRMEESRYWQSKGARSPAEHQAQLAGTTTGRAQSALEISRRCGRERPVGDGVVRATADTTCLRRLGGERPGQHGGGPAPNS